MYENNSVGGPATALAVSRPRGSSRPASDGLRSGASMWAAWQQAALVAAIIALTSILSRIGGGLPSRFFFMTAGVAAAGFYIRRSPWQYVTLTLWFWTVTPFVRRIIDYNGYFDPVNIVLGLPNLLALFMLKDVLTSRDLLRQRESLIGLLLFLPILYGLIVSFVRGDVVTGAVGASGWVAPILYYFFFLANWRRIEEMEKPFRHFLSINGFIVIGYGFYQYVSPPPWDVAWVINSGFPPYVLPYQIRVFSTTNVPGVLALWLVALVLLSLHFKTRISVLLAPAGAFLLLMTMVRSMVGAVLLGLILAGLMGRPGIFKLVGTGVIALVLIGAGASVVVPDLLAQLAARYDTVTELSNDTSALGRVGIYEEAPAQINQNPFGMGLGGFGRGSVAVQSAVGLDSGPLAIYLTLGWVAGSVYIAGLVLVLAQALLAALRARSSIAITVAVTAVAGASILPFMNMTDFFATVTWIFSAYAAALGMVARARPQTSMMARPSYLPAFRKENMSTP